MARAAPFFQDQDEVTDDLGGEVDAVTPRTPTLAAGSTPSRPPSSRKKPGAKPARFIEQMAHASSSDGVEDEEDEGIETPEAMRDFVVEDHQSEEATTRSRARLTGSTGAAPHAATTASSTCSIIGTPTSAAGLTPAAGERRPRCVFSPTTPVRTPGGSRALPNSAYGRRRRRPRLMDDEDVDAPEGVRGLLSLAITP